MAGPFKMTGFSGFGNSPLRDHEKDADGKVIKHEKKKEEKKERPKYIQNDPALTRYYNAMDAWEKAGSPSGKQPNINDYVSP